MTYINYLNRLQLAAVLVGKNSDLFPAGQPCTAVLDPCSGTSEGCQLVLESHIAEIGYDDLYTFYQIRD